MAEAIFVADIAHRHDLNPGQIVNIASQWSSPWQLLAFVSISKKLFRFPLGHSKANESMNIEQKRGNFEILHLG